MVSVAAKRGPRGSTGTAAPARSDAADRVVVDMGISCVEGYGLGC